MENVALKQYLEGYVIYTGGPVGLALYIGVNVRQAVFSLERSLYKGRDCGLFQTLPEQQHLEHGLVQDKYLFNK